MPFARTELPVETRLQSQRRMKGWPSAKRRFVSSQFKISPGKFAGLKFGSYKCGTMALSGEAKKAYMREYMRRRYQEKKAFAWEAALRRERQMMKKALHRVKMAEKWKNAEELANENALSLAWQWNALVKEEKAKNKSYPRIRRRAVRRPIRNAVAVSLAVKGPLPLPSRGIIIGDDESD